MDEPRATRDVFIAGEFPQLTYNPRKARSLETELNKYLLDRGKCLVVSGPSKAGKTVLVEKTLPPDSAIWINGADLASVDYLWTHIVEELDLYTEVGYSDDESSSVTAEGGVEAGVPLIKFKAGVSPSTGRRSGITGKRNSAPVTIAKSELTRKPVPIVLDDFHYVPDGVRKDVARAVKDLIRKTHVILIAVPHEAFEPVRSERDMNGRVWGLPVLPWDEEELGAIAREGFGLLNLVDHGEVIGKELAKTSLGAPFLMQQLCLEYVLTVANVSRTAEPAMDLTAPADWSDFYRIVADRFVPGDFAALIKGKNPRGTERVRRDLKDGRATDIYGAIFYTLSKMGPRRSVTPQQVLHDMEKYFVEVPKSHQLTGIMSSMAQIAWDTREEDEDPVVDFKNGEFHILDPFLSFYLRHGSWDLPEPPHAEV